MLPQIQVNSNKPPPRRKRPRPINPSDTAASTGLAVNPNGTYVANPYPTTAQSGMQGAYGSMLPPVSVPSFMNQLGGMALNAAGNFTNYQGAGLQSGMQTLGQGANAYRQIYNSLATDQNIRRVSNVSPALALGLANSRGVGSEQGARPGSTPLGQQNAQAHLQMQRLIQQGVPPSTAAQIVGGGGSTPTNFASGNSFMNSAGGVNLQPGLNNDQFTIALNDRLLQNPEDYDALPQSAKDALQLALSGGAKTDAQGNTYTADESQSQGGRFTQVGDVKWERNKNGRLVKVQYTGGGSWRNKRVVQGGKGQGKRNAAARAAAQEAPTTAGFVGGFGVVSFNTGTG